MVGYQPRTRVCARCNTHLALDNIDRFCSACRSKATDELVKPPTVPRSFWTDAHMAGALDSWHMGKVFAAYRTHPQHCRTLSQEVVAGWLNLTQAQLSRIEKGRAPEELSKLIHWANVLGIPSDLLWFKLPNDRARPRTPVFMSSDVQHQRGLPDAQEDLIRSPQTRGEHVERRSFLGLGATIAATKVTTVADFLATFSMATTPSVVSDEDIAQVRQAATLFTTWDHTYGGGIVRETVIAQLRWSAQLLNADCPSELHSELFAAVGYLSGVCGFMAFDAFAHAEARKMFTFGLACAEEVGEWHLRAKLLSNMARQAIWCGDPDSGLTYTELALVRSDRLTATERAMLHTARARALGKLGRVQETLSAIGMADEAFASAIPSEDPPWMAYYDHAQHNGDTGHALFDLAVRGEAGDRAFTRLRTAVSEHGDGYARSRAISGTKLATLAMVQGDPAEALSIARRAIEDAGQLRSQRAASDLAELRRVALHRGKSSEAIELGERISALTGSR